MNLVSVVISVAVFLLFGIAIFEVWQFRQRLHVSSSLVRTAKPYTSSFDTSNIRILVAGDSTAVGVGAEDNTLSIAGRLQGIYPDAHIEVVGESGYKAAELLNELQQIDSSYNLVLLQIGGNDIIRFTKLEQLETTMKVLFERTKEIGDTQILMTSGNVGLAPIFPFPLTYIYTERTLRVRSMFSTLAAQYNIEYVDLFEKREDDPFTRDPDKYYAADMLHPSGAGYELWFEKLQRVLPKHL